MSTKSLSIDPIRYNGSVTFFRAWMDRFLLYAGNAMLPASISQEEIIKRGFNENKGGNIIDLSRFYPRLIVRYSEKDKSSAREVWYVTKYDPITDNHTKLPKRWATILAVETFPNNTIIEFLDGIYFRLATPSGSISYARTEFIGEEFSSYAKFIKDEWEKDLQNIGKVPHASQPRVAPDVHSPETEITKIFISYSHQDKTFAKKLAGELENQGMKVWWDFDSLKGGQDWQKEIERGIKQCDFFLVALTPDAVASEWVGNEITYANQAQKTIIPLHLKKCDFPIGLIKKQYIDFEKQTQKSALKELIQLLKAYE